jgi:hypothetical protein
LTHSLGQTTNFTLELPDNNQSDSNSADGQDHGWNSLSSAQQTAVTNHANFLLGPVTPGGTSVVENAFNITTGWFATPAGKFGTGNRQVIAFDLPNNSGAYNTGYGNPIHIDPRPNDASSTGDEEAAMLWMAEWAEVLMSIAGNWNAGDSSGEGLSHYCALQNFLAGHNSYYGNRFVSNWLNGTGTTNQGTPTPNAARSDWVNTTYTGSTVNGTFVHGDGDPVSYGCALVFLYYLTVQLGFTINEVIAQYSGTLASCYHAVTGDSTNPFPGFMTMVDNLFPTGTTANPSGNNPDNLFPTAIVSFYAQKNTFGKDEAQDIIDRQGGLVNNAFSVVIDGLSKQAFTDLNIQVGPFTGAFAALQGNGIQITPNPARAQFQNGVNDKSPQRILIPYDITLSQPLIAQFPASGVGPELDLDVTLTSNGATVNGSNGTMDFELIAAGDPYFSNTNPTLGNQPYLSQDLRVFSAAQAFNNTPFPGGPTFQTDSFDGAYQYIRGLVAYLNTTASFTNPAGDDPFAQLPDQNDEGQTDSSVSPFAFQFEPGQIFPTFANNYTFALARVRMQGATGDASENVRVFFRVFTSQTPDTDFNTSTTYVSATDSNGKPGTPLPGTGQTTLPCFATGNAGTETDYQTGGSNIGTNIQTLTIPAGRDQLYQYYGCFLNFYDPTNTIGGAQIQTLLAGTHHCLVAEIAYDDAPIPAGVSPMSWDQLAQRNLYVTTIDNPGPAAAHWAPQTFDVRPSPVRLSQHGFQLPPDELVIDWGKIPKGSIASIYWPAVAASDVISLAEQWGDAPGLTASDAHTLQVEIEGGLTYLPIPEGTGQNFAGLLTVEVPIGVKKGQEFEVVVKRLAPRLGKRTPPPPPPPPTPKAPAAKATTRKAKVTNAAPRIELDSAAGGDVVAEAVIRPLVYRQVVGTFIVRIPVSTDEVMLIPEQMTLAVMRWRLANVSPSNRWHPVLERYVQYLVGRLEVIGGDPSKVPASYNWHPLAPGRHRHPGGGYGHHHPIHPGHRDDAVCGKVVEVLFDCHGEFEGFVLAECCSGRLVQSRERSVGELVLRAARERLTVCVKFCEESERIETIAIVAS